MAYKINYLPLAVQDLTDIAQYLSGFYPKTAPRVLREIRERIERLSTTPNMCEEYEHDPSYRKLVFAAGTPHQILRHVSVVCQQLLGVFRQTVSAARCQVLDNIFHKFLF